MTYIYDNELGRLNRQINHLERQQRRNAGQVVDPSWYALLSAPTCPPSRQIRVHGGVAWCDESAFGEDYSNRCYTIPDLTCDLDDADSVVTALEFRNALYYQSYTLVLLIPIDTLENPAASDWQFRLVGSGSEFATAGEAEHGLETFMLDNPAWPEHDDPDGAGMVLCGLVLRNNGITGPGANILPIDRLNRGRSYLWPSDLRPRWFPYL